MWGDTRLCFGMVCYGMVWYDLVWCGMVWYTLSHVVCDATLYCSCIVVRLQRFETVSALASLQDPARKLSRLGKLIYGLGVSKPMSTVSSSIIIMNTLFMGVRHGL